MSIRRIRVFPDPILRKKCRVVRRVDDKVRELAADMIETMDAMGGLGLAANQVGRLQRVVTLHLPGDESAVNMAVSACWGFALGRKVKTLPVLSTTKTRSLLGKCVKITGWLNCKSG